MLTSCLLLKHFLRLRCGAPSTERIDAVKCCACEFHLIQQEVRLGNKSCFIFTETKPSQWLKKKKCNSTFLCKNWVKSKWNPFVSRLNANKHDPTLHVLKLQHIPKNEAGLLESECKRKCIPSIYIGQVLTPGTTSSGSGEAGLCLSVWTLSTSASLFLTHNASTCYCS